MTYREILQQGEDLLQKAEDPDCKTDAWLLFSYCLRMDRAQYMCMMQDIAPDFLSFVYMALVRKKAGGCPVQYLLGTQSFMGLDFFVNEDVLIPRSDTEVLAEQTLRQLPRGGRMLDLCTGSGCIAVAVKHLRPDAQVWASDLSEDVLTVARLNADYHQADICFVQSDLLEDIPERFDLIVSNPPYIETAEIEDLAVQVRDYEPRMALDGGADGLAYYRRILRTAGSRLHPKGRLLLEIGCGQGQTVSALAAGNGWTDIEIQKDLAGCDRVLSAKMRSEICNV